MLVEFEGETGQETQEGKGEQVSSTGLLGYLVASTSDTGLRTQYHYYGGEQGGTPGLFLEEWEGEAPIDGLPGYFTPLSFALNEPIQLLPAPANVGSLSQWTYAIEAEATSAPITGFVLVYQNGRITDKGKGHTTSTPAGQLTNGLKISHEYEQDRSGLGAAGMEGITRAMGTHYYVEGLGLVYEKIEHTANSDGTGALVERTLKSYTGLTPTSP
jgi:hypothetical protein